MTKRNGKGAAGQWLHNRDAVAGRAWRPGRVVKFVFATKYENGREKFAFQHVLL